jgi:hypothetical protein
MTFEKQRNFLICSKDFIISHQLEVRLKASKIKLSKKIPCRNSDAKKNAKVCSRTINPRDRHIHSKSTFWMPQSNFLMMATDEILEMFRLVLGRERKQLYATYMESHGWTRTWSRADLAGTFPTKNS